MNLCLNCGKETTNPKFCSKSCAACYNNKRRTRTNESKQKISELMKNKPFIKNQFGSFIPKKYSLKDKESIIAGPYTKVFMCTCKYSAQKFYSTTPKQVHPDLASSKKEYTYSCQFRFGISKYPKWFSGAAQLIETYGWYSTPGSRKGITNVSGISRDHLYSITDGWKNNIPPNIIRHPANCELIPHKENQSKHKKSKISIEELMHRIKEFTQLYGESAG